MVDQKYSFQRRENVWRNLPCNDTLELIATVALLTFLHKAVATVTSIYGLPEVMKNLRNILSIILLSYNAFGLQKLDTEPQIPRGCHQKIFQKSFLPLCKGRELRGYASFRCLSTWTSRTCRLSRRPLACSPFFPQGHAWLQKHASAHEPAPKSEKIIGQTRLRMAKSGKFLGQTRLRMAMRRGILLCWRLRMLMKSALKL